MITRWQEVFKEARPAEYNAEQGRGVPFPVVWRDTEIWPFDGRVHCSGAALADVYWARCNPNLVRLTGVNNPRFNQSQGDSTDYKFIKHIQRFLTPWDQAQTPLT